MIVVGAGMAGLLAAGMLRGEVEAVWEAAPRLPNNHSAVLRFRSSVVGDTLNIPFKEVTAFKTSIPWLNPIADALRYSLDTNGTATARSILSAQTPEPLKRYIAPPDLIRRMADRVTADIQYSQTLTTEAVVLANSIGTKMISTIPMPALMEILDWKPQSEFKSRSGFNYVATLRGVDAYVSVYVPDPKMPFSRISITRDQLVVESYSEMPNPSKMIIEEAIRLLGLDHGMAQGQQMLRQNYAKILPIDEEERRAFIMWASEKHNIYSLGRFATWRPGLLLDDVVNDVRVIQRLASSSETVYGHILKGTKS